MSGPGVAPQHGEYSRWGKIATRKAVCGRLPHSDRDSDNTIHSEPLRGAN